MARIKGVEAAQAGWVTRFMYWLARRKVGAMTGDSRLVEPVTIHAHHPRVFRAYGQMEMGQAAATVPAALKTLGGLLADRMIGCPY